MKSLGWGTGSSLFCGVSDTIKNCDDIPVGSVAYVYGNSINTPFSDENTIIISVGLTSLYVQIGIRLSDNRLKIRSKYIAGWTHWVEK